MGRVGKGGEFGGLGWGRRRGFGGRVSSVRDEAEKLYGSVGGDINILLFQ